MNHDDYPASLLRGILRRCRTIAMVGVSQNWVRPSNFAMKYLQIKGYRIIPVNPARAGGGDGRSDRADPAPHPAPP